MIKSTLTIIISFTVLTILCFSPEISNAQYLPDGFDEQISFELSPSTPEPNETATARITSFMTDLNKANISWYVNDALVESGLGLRSIDFTVGNPGSSTSIRVVIQKNEGGTLEKTYSIAPAEVALLYEALTHTPPFYKGKALASHQSLIKFIAVPNFVDSNGNKIPSSQIVFTWDINGTVDGKNSGAGIDTYIYEAPLISRPVKVTLRASAVNGNQEAREIKTFNLISPYVLFYGRNPLYGTVFERAIQGETELVGKEIQIAAVPYFFSIDNLEKIDINWSLNGAKLANEKANIISFRRTNSNPGIANVGIEINHLDNILQSAKNSFTIFFDQNSDLDFEF